MDINDNQFRNMVRENYREADIYDLWDSYVITDNHARRYRKVGWISDEKDSEIEMAVLIELMRAIPHNKKIEFYNELIVDYNHSKVIIDNLLSFFESIELFRGEVLNRHEKIKIEYDNYRNLSTHELWREFVKEDKKFMFAMYGTKETGSKEVLRPDDKRLEEKVLFDSLEKTRILIGLLKEKLEEEIKNLYRHVESRRCLANEEGKKAIDIYLGFIDREILGYIKLKKII